jgi:hypothetical protein
VCKEKIEDLNICSYFEFLVYTKKTNIVSYCNFFMLLTYLGVRGCLVRAPVSHNTVLSATAHPATLQSTWKAPAFSPPQAMASCSVAWQSVAGSQTSPKFHGQLQFELTELSKESKGAAGQPPDPYPSMCFPDEGKRSQADSGNRRQDTPNFLVKHPRSIYHHRAPAELLPAGRRAVLRS